MNKYTNIAPTQTMAQRQVNVAVAMRPNMINLQSMPVGQVAPTASAGTCKIQPIKFVRENWSNITQWLIAGAFIFV